MKNFKSVYLAILPLLALPFFLINPLSETGTGKLESKPKAITWMSMNEALAANQKEKKLIFIDVYTDWCGWCKVMDRETFSQAAVIDYMNENFYCVKLNAEKYEEVVNVRGQEFKLVDAGKRNIHTLAYALLDGQMSYPSYVYLNGDLERIRISKGFKKTDPFLLELENIVQNNSVQ